MNVLKIISNVFGGLFLIFGFASLFTTFLAGVCLMFVGIILIPYFFDKIDPKREFRGWKKILTIIALLIVTVLAIIRSAPSNPVSNITPIVTSNPVTASSSQSNQNSGLNTAEIFNECKTVGHDYSGTEINQVSRDCLDSKANSVAQCKDYENRIIYTYHDVTENFKSEDTDKCIENLAFNRNDSTVCSQISSNSLIQYCYSNIAVTTKNPKICLTAINTTDCYQNYLNKLNIQQVCSQKPNGNFLTERVACMYEELKINKKTLSPQDTSICEIMGIQGWGFSETNSICIAGIGVYLEKPTICDQAGQYKADCYGMIARNNQSFSLSDCDKAGIDYVGCYVAVAVNNLNTTICYELPQGNVDTCLIQIVQNTKTYSNCRQFLGNESERCTTYFAPSMKPENYTIEFCEDLATLSASGHGVGVNPNQCFYEVATRTLNLTLCDKITEDATKNECNTIIQHASKNN